MTAKLTHVMWRNDLLPVLKLIGTYADGTAVNISAATTPTFHMRAVDSDTLKIDAAADVTDGANGGISYAWTGTDTDTAGRYLAEFEVTIDGNKLTFPGPGQSLEVVIRADLA